ncbi:MAG: OmpA family protein [Spirochaetes bacterium]|nr:OmpA family protein [Spirochaetota bacterium]MBU0955563.1 OmpA family protein [Spirochaetota bacterium]
MRNETGHTSTIPKSRNPFQPCLMDYPIIRQLIPLLLLSVLSAQLWGQTPPSATPGGQTPLSLRHQFVQGDKYRVLSKVSEDIYINRRYSHSSEITNRIAFEVTGVKPDGSGQLRGTFQTGSVSSARGYEVTQEYESEYWQNPLGRYDILPRYFMPVVRHVPTFPERQLLPGDSWTAPAEERHDFRNDFGIAEPYVIPFEVRYRYQGPGNFNDTAVELIQADYTIFYQPPPPASWTLAYPVQISGYSNQLHYWDNQRGGLMAYEEQFKFIFELSNGAIVEYRGIAWAEVIEADLMDRDSVEDQVRDAVGNIADVSIQSDSRGVTISLENIRFEADSTRLLPGEMDKVRQIAEVLKQIPGYNLQISGHTALAGTVEARAQLSHERARTIAELLIQLAVREAEDITVIGYGAERPIAPNTTEAGRSRNRRVEITILEN